jgi:hypothetical protein
MYMYTFICSLSVCLSVCLSVEQCVSCLFNVLFFVRSFMSRTKSPRGHQLVIQQPSPRAIAARDSDVERD